MAETSEFEELCTFESGRFTASVSGRYNLDTQTYTYAANILCDDTRLFDMQLKHELAGLRRVATEGGEEWLESHLHASGVPDRLASAHDVQDLQIAVRTSEKLIGRFAEHGHEAALKDRTVLQDIGLEARQEAKQQVPTITRER